MGNRIREDGGNPAVPPIGRDPGAFPRSRGGARGARRARGFTLVELVFASLILVVALGGLTSSILAGLRLARSNEETATASEAARSMVERIQGTQFDRIFFSYNAWTGDDVPGVAAPGASFLVAGLRALDDDPDGMPGVVEFPTLFQNGKLELREDVDDLGFAMPRDLSGDGVVDGADHSEDYVVLPVRVRIEWLGASGVRSVERSILLAR